MGKGRYYVGHPEYQRRFEESLGYAPYPGTLNVKVEEEGMMQRISSLRGDGGTKISGFEVGGETFSPLTCFDGELRGKRVTLLLIDVTYYNRSVAELISPVYLRGDLALKDGDNVDFSVEVS